MLNVVLRKAGNYSRSQPARTKLDEPGRSRLLEEELLETGTWLLGLVAVELSMEWDVNVRNPVARRIVGLSCSDGWLIVCLAWMKRASFHRRRDVFLACPKMVASLHNGDPPDMVDCARAE